MLLRDCVIGICARFKMKQWSFFKRTSEKTNMQPRAVNKIQRKTKAITHILDFCLLNGLNIATKRTTESVSETMDDMAIERKVQRPASLHM